MQANQEDDEMLQGVDWGRVEEYTDLQSRVDEELPGRCSGMGASRSNPLLVSIALDHLNGINRSWLYFHKLLSLIRNP